MIPAHRTCLSAALVLLGLAVSITWPLTRGLATPFAAEDEPHMVHEARPVITRGPYLVDPGETAVTVVWVTDTPSHSKVVYGQGDELIYEAEPAEHGMLPVGTLHVVRLTGLTPGQRYSYRAVSTRVVELQPYWPEKGLATESPVYSFTTFDRAKPSIAFAFITDTHEDVSRIRALMGLIDWRTTDFLVHGGDAFDWLEGEDQLFERWLDPIGEGLAHARPLILARGNHEMRGPFARNLFDYLPIAEGRYYYARDHGPVHLIVIDTGEDKPDATDVYANLNRLALYRAEEFEWFRDHVESSARLAGAPFRVVVMHQPDWGWVDGENERWTELANRAGVDLVIAGHLHRFAWIESGERGNDFPILVVGKDQVARVEATANELRVTVIGRDGRVVGLFEVPAG